MIIWIAFVCDGGHPNGGMNGKAQQRRKWKRCANPAMKDTQWTLSDGMKRSKHICSTTLKMGWMIWRPETRSTTIKPAVVDRYFNNESTCPNPFPLRTFPMT